jgi:hypothetical protein
VSEKDLYQRMKAAESPQRPEDMGDCWLTTLEHLNVPGRFFTEETKILVDGMKELIALGAA